MARQKSVTVSTIICYQKFAFVRNLLRFPREMSTENVGPKADYSIDMEIQIVGLEKMASQTIYLLNSNCCDTSIYQRQCYSTQRPWICLSKRSWMLDIGTIRSDIMKFLGTQTRSIDRVTLGWQFYIGKCAQIRKKTPKNRSADTLYRRGPVSNLLQLSGRICYQTRQKS